MRRNPSNARSVAITAILISALVLNLHAQDSRGESQQSIGSQQSIEAVTFTSGTSAKAFIEDARELAHVIETNPTLEIKARRLSPFSEMVLLKYIALNQQKIPMLVAAMQGRSPQVEAMLKRVGATIYFAAPDIDYFRCIVNIDQVRYVFNFADVLDVHLGMIANIGNEFDADGFPPPRYHVDAIQDDNNASNMPAIFDHTPYHLVHRSVGLDQFWTDHPTYDGRGVTIAQIDGGAIHDKELLVHARDLNGHLLPKYTRVYNPYDYHFESMFGSLTPRNPDVLVRLTEPVITRDSTLRVKERFFHVPGPGRYSLGVWRSVHTSRQYSVLLNDDTREVRFDLDGDNSFANDEPFRDFNESHKPFVGLSGGKPKITGVLEIRPDHSIVVVYQNGHAIMSSVSAAGNALPGLGPIGSAPGAQLAFASMRTGVYPYIEAALQMARDPTVDIIDYSSRPVVYREGQSFVAKMISRISRVYAKPIFASAGNGGQFAAIGPIAHADGVIAVGGYDDNQGVAKADAVTAEGPSLLGHVKPNILVPSPMITGSSYSSSCDEIRKSGALTGVPKCVSLISATSFSAPYAAGIGATLLSAAKQEHLPVDGWLLRYALEASAHFLPGSPANAQGNGAVDIQRAWRILKNDAGKDRRYFTAAYVPDPDSHNTRSIGRGVFELDGPAPGESVHRTICFLVVGRSASEVAGAKVTLVGNDGTFKVSNSLTAVGRSTACLGLLIQPTVEGVHSTLIRLTIGTSMIAVAQATSISPARLSPSNSYTVTRTGTAIKTEPRSFWFAIPNTATAPNIRLNILAGDGALQCLPNGKQHDVYNSYYAPRLVARQRPVEALKHAVGTFWTVLDFPRSTVWKCSVSAARPSSEVTFDLQVSLSGLGLRAIAPENEPPHLDIRAPSITPIDSVILFEPVIARIDVVPARPGQYVSRDFTVPHSASSLRIEPIHGPKDSVPWTLFRCPREQCRAWYSSSLDRHHPRTLTIANPEPGAWKLVVGPTLRRLGVHLVVTAQAPPQRTLPVSPAASTNASRIVLPPECHARGCLVRLYDPAVHHSMEHRPLAPFSSPDDRTYWRLYESTTLLLTSDSASDSSQIR